MLFDDDDVDSSADDAGCRWLGEVEAPEGGRSAALLLNGWAGCCCCCCCCWQPEVVEEEEEEVAKLAKMRRSS